MCCYDRVILSSIPLMYCIILIYLNAEVCFETWNENNLIMTYNLCSVLLNFVCKNFMEDFSFWTLFTVCVCECVCGELVWCMHTSILECGLHQCMHIVVKRMYQVSYSIIFCLIPLRVSE